MRYKATRPKTLKPAGPREKKVRGVKPKILTKEMILKAQAMTMSNHAAARNLHVSYQHFRKYAKMYVNDEGIPLIECNKNQAGRGIPKYLKNSKKDPSLLDIMEGRISAAHFQPDKLKYRLIEEGYLREECSICGFKEHRLLDYKMPLLMHFKDNNKMNYSLDNIELLCYNHFFLTIGDVFTDKDIHHIESHLSHPKNTSEKVNWELDDYQLQRLRELGLSDEEEDDIDKYISRI